MVVTTRRERRAHQVRLELLPRDEDLLHQRDREPLRGARRRRAGGGEGPRHGPPHRLEVPARRARATAARASPRTRWRSRPWRARRGSRAASWTRPSRRTSTRCGTWSRRSCAASAVRRAAAWWRCSGSRSSPTPTTCARRRRSTIIAGLKRRGVRVRAYDPVAMPNARALPEHGNVTLDEGRLRLRARGRRGGHRHRVERVPEPEPRPSQAPAAPARAVRPAQPLRARRGRGRGLPPRRRGPRAGGRAGRRRGRAGGRHDRRREGQEAQGHPRRARLPDGDAARRRRVLPALRPGLPLGRLSRGGEGLALPQEADRPLRVREGHGQGRALRRARGRAGRRARSTSSSWASRTPSCSSSRRWCCTA